MCRQRSEKTGDRFSESSGGAESDGKEDCDKDATCALELQARPSDMNAAGLCLVGILGLRLNGRICHAKALQSKVR